MSDYNYYRAIETLKDFTDFLRKFIPQEKAEEINMYYQEQSVKPLGCKYELSYSEKCNLDLDKFFDSDFCSRSSLLPEVIAAIDNIDDNTVRNLNLFSFDELLKPSDPNLLKLANELLKEEEFVSVLLDDNKVSCQQKELIRLCYAGEAVINTDNFNLLFPTLEDKKDLCRYYQSLVDKEQFKKQPWSEKTTVQFYRAAKAVQDKYKDIYDICLASRQNKYDLYYWFCTLDSLRFYDVESFYSYYNVIGAFLKYQQVYSNEWSDYLLYGVKCATVQVQDKLGFIQYLNAGSENGGAKFGGVFAEWLENIQRTNKVNIIDTKLLFLCHNKNANQSTGKEDWYEKIPNIKVSARRIITECLDNLFKELLQRGWIAEDTNRELFIYRFSGQNVPYDINFKIGWTGKPATLGKIIRCLYQTSTTVPPYRKISNFFGIDNNVGGASNITIHNRTAQEIVQLLESCGFVQVNVFEDPSKKKCGENVS